MTIPMVCDTFSVDQKNEMYKIISIILTCRKRVYQRQSRFSIER